MQHTKKALLSRLRFYRKEDASECKLINARASWLMYMQTLLITSYFIIATSSDQIFVFYNSFLLFIIAIYFAVAFGGTIRAAEKMVLQLHFKEKRLYETVLALEDQDTKEELLTYFVDKYGSTDQNDVRQNLSFSFNRRITPVVIIFWICLFGFSTFNFIAHKHADDTRPPEHSTLQ